MLPKQVPGGGGGEAVFVPTNCTIVRMYFKNHWLVGSKVGSHSGCDTRAPVATWPFFLLVAGLVDHV